jgi:hypothetical protein
MNMNLEVEVYNFMTWLVELNCGTLEGSWGRRWR